MAPDALSGVEMVNQEKKISEMSAEEIMGEFKNKAFMVGNVTK